MNIHLERYKQQILENFSPQGEPEVSAEPQQVAAPPDAESISAEIVKQLSPETAEQLNTFLETILSERNNNKIVNFVSILHMATYEQYEDQAMDSRDNALNIQ